MSVLYSWSVKSVTSLLDHLIVFGLRMYSYFFSIIQNIKTGNLLYVGFICTDNIFSYSQSRQKVMQEIKSLLINFCALNIFTKANFKQLL